MVSGAADRGGGRSASRLAALAGSAGAQCSRGNRLAPWPQSAIEPAPRPGRASGPAQPAVEPAPQSGRANGPAQLVPPLGRGRTRRAGFTLIEMVVGLGIVSVLFAAVVIGVGALTGAKAKEAATELSGVIRTLYDTASLTGKTCRLVFELPSEKDEDGAVTYHAECAKAGLTAAKNRDEEQKDARNEGENRKKKDKLDEDDRRFTRADSDDAPSLQELMAREKSRVEEAAKFSTFTTEEIPARTLPEAVRIWVWTKSLRKPTKAGPAYLYFFPQGFTDRAQVYVRQGSNVWTLKVSPLTGKVATVAEDLEVPRT